MLASVIISLFPRLKAVEKRVASAATCFALYVYVHYAARCSSQSPSGHALHRRGTPLAEAAPPSSRQPKTLYRQIGYISAIERQLFALLLGTIEKVALIVTSFIAGGPQKTKLSKKRTALIKSTSYMSILVVHFSVRFHPRRNANARATFCDLDNHCLLELR